MNPWLSLLLLALGAIGIILVVALISSVALLATGRRYALKEYDRTKEEIARLLGDEALAERLLEGEELPADCQNREQIGPILDAYRAQQERIRNASEELEKKRSQKRRVLKFLTEKKDKGEWI